MKHSESILKIAPALLEAQKKIGHAPKSGNNPFFHSTYSTLGDVMEVCKTPLNEQGITILQPVGTSELGLTTVETVLLHESGEWISETMQISVKTQNNPQEQGSAISYAKRYSLQALVFIPSEDDDAEAATQSNRTKVVDRGDGYTREQEDMADAVNTAPQSVPLAGVGAAVCPLHNKPMKSRPDGSIDHRIQLSGVWNTCRGTGYTAQKGGSTNAS
jgi:hypothetical protein